MTSPKILLVIDVQQSFFEDINGSTTVPDAEGLKQRILSVLSKARKEQIKVIFIRHSDPPDPNFTPDTPAWEIASFLSPPPSSTTSSSSNPEPIIDKTKRNAFVSTSLESLITSFLRPSSNPQITCIGLQTDFCVRATSLGAKEVFPNAEVRLVRGAHGTYNAGGDWEGKGVLGWEEIGREVEKEVEGKGVVIVEWDEVAF
ncbi:hypothetical protein UCRPC4_g05003 [Phaeomoniella chlamydospora]|uniref:Isochorismatase-like domain-containing protein n=1 Tax=Phaeomoniella chlamydospora TaxID=158046 RepID=A0A0G2E7U7_PHACM|nr:hypothetical protein UCRPC4_g05003 [Phaeomoniella chlamydospora]